MVDRWNALTAALAPLQNLTGLDLVRALWPGADPDCSEVLREGIGGGLAYAEATPVDDPDAAEERVRQALATIPAGEFRTLKDLVPRDDQKLSPEVLERLRSLGYIN